MDGEGRGELHADRNRDDRPGGDETAEQNIANHNYHSELLFSFPVLCWHAALSQNDPYVMHKLFDPPISPEALQRMSFEEKYEGFCVDLVKVPLS